MECCHDNGPARLGPAGLTSLTPRGVAFIGSALSEQGEGKALRPARETNPRLDRNTRDYMHE